MFKLSRVVAFVGVVATGCSLAMHPAPTPLPARGTIDCSSGTEPVVLDTVAAVIAGALSILVLEAGPLNERSGDPDDQSHLIIGGSLGGIAVAYFASAIYGGVVAHGCDKAFETMAAREHEARERERETAARAATRERANQLTKRAHAAAVAGDCATVETIEPDVRTSDRDFYDAVFARDVAIRRCLDATK